MKNAQRVAFYVFAEGLQIFALLSMKPLDFKGKQAIIFGRVIRLEPNSWDVPFFVSGVMYVDDPPDHGITIVNSDAIHCI